MTTGAEAALVAWDRVRITGTIAPPCGWTRAAGPGTRMLPPSAHVICPYRSTVVNLPLLYMTVAWGRCYSASRVMLRAMCDVGTGVMSQTGHGASYLASGG